MNNYSPGKLSAIRHRRFHPALFSVVVIFLTLAAACNRTSEDSASSNDPDQLLRQMSVSLAQAKNLSFKVDRKLDPALVEGRDVPETTEIEISVSRPGKFLAKSNSKDNVRHLFFDGKNLSIYDETMKLYATVPVAGTIDTAVAKIDETYGFTPPLAEFILSDPYGALGKHIKSKAYKGKESVNGIECHHLALSGDVADSELWIGTGDFLPRKLVATFKDREGKPQLEANFSNWNLAPSLDDKIFAFAAPKDAEKVVMVTEAEMQETAAKESAAPESTPKSSPVKKGL